MANALHVFESMEPAWLERRRAERVEARLRVVFRELPLEEGDEAVYSMEHSNVHLLAYQAGAKIPQDVQEAQTRDISIKGVRVGGDMNLCGGRALATGSFLALEISLASNSHILRAIAVVKWSKKMEGEKFEAGLAILSLDEGDVQHLQSFIEQHR